MNGHIIDGYSVFNQQASVGIKAHRRTPSAARDAEFREMTLHNARESLHKELEKLIITAKPEHRTVSCNGFKFSFLILVLIVWSWYGLTLYFIKRLYELVVQDEFVQWNFSFRI